MTDASNTPQTEGTMTTQPKPAGEEGEFFVRRSVCLRRSTVVFGDTAHLSPQRDALGKLLHGQLVVEVALLGRAAQPADHGGGGEDDDDEEAQAVDEYF